MNGTFSTAVSAASAAKIVFCGVNVIIEVLRLVEDNAAAVRKTATVRWSPVGKQPLA